MDTAILSWVFQALILGTGIYAFLRFLRTTRGSGLMRGLMMTLLLGLVVLAGLSKALGLLELEKLIESFTPSLAVILVILFQPELRRIISQLGEQNRLGKLLNKTKEETISEVVQAAAAMAGRRVGALIAFEGEFDSTTTRTMPSNWTAQSTDSRWRASSSPEAACTTAPLWSVVIVSLPLHACSRSPKTPICRNPRGRDTEPRWA